MFVDFFQTIWKILWRNLHLLNVANRKAQTVDVSYDENYVFCEVISIYNLLYLYYNEQLLAVLFKI